MDNYIEPDDNVRFLIRRQLTLRSRSARHAAVLRTMMEIANEATPPTPGERTPDSKVGVETRRTVIRRAPPRRSPEAGETTGGKTRRSEARPTGVILIRDAILYRILDILLWKVMGETRLKSFGYPFATTRQLLWRIVQSAGGMEQQQEDDARRQDHDCGGNLNCFASHVYQFLQMCAPNLWTRTGWESLSIEDVLRKIYYEDLIPYLRSVDLRNSLNVLQCHSDIVLLEKWERQKFTAVTWSGEKYLSQVYFNCPRCPQCSNHHF